MLRLTVVLLFLCCLAIVGVAANAAEKMPFVTRQGDQLMDGGKPLRFISFNIPNLLVVEDAYSFKEPSPWRWPDEFEIEDALESVRQMGGTVVRTYVISVWREGSDMGETVHVLRPGEFNEEAFRVLDKVMEVAHRKGIRILIPFVDNAKWMGGIPQYAAFRGKQPEAFWSDPEVIADFKKTVEHVINRKNTYTGIAYKDDPAVFAWETGNEIDATPEWTREIAAYIKELDQNHLVMDGRSLRGVDEWMVDEPNTDIITTHHYPWGANTDFVPPIQKAHAMTKGKKPYVIGEFGFVPTPQIRAVYDTTIADGIAGALLWSLRFHSRDGGFYWHMEVGTGGNFYKAYHWPGFASGAAYDEKAVLELTRDKAFEIQGMAPPSISPPAPPTMLPIEHPSAISWQGSAGASGYDIERAESMDGPWTVVGENVSDAAVQYRPLFADSSADPGKTYYYRAVARNSAGTSDPSNAIGPVTATHRTLVDECADLKQVDSSEGDVAERSDNVRRMQEDANRLVLAPGAAVVYRVDGPIRAWRIFAFAAKPEEDYLKIAAASDDGKFEAVQSEREAFGSGAGDYGYLVPVLLQGTVADGQSLLKIESLTDAPAGEPIQISRVEIDYGDAE